MANTSNAATLDISGPSAPGAFGPVLYDRHGMPMTLRAAKAMTVATVTVALERTLLALRRSATPVAAAAPLDSLEVLYLVHQFYKPLKRKALDLSAVDRDRWSTLSGVAEVLAGAMRGLA